MMVRKSTCIYTPKKCETTSIKTTIVLMVLSSVIVHLFPSLSSHRWILPSLFDTFFKEPRSREITRNGGQGPRELIALFRNGDSRISFLECSIREFDSPFTGKCYLEPGYGSLMDCADGNVSRVTTYPSYKIFVLLIAPD